MSTEPTIRSLLHQIKSSPDPRWIGERVADALALLGRVVEHADAQLRAHSGEDGHHRCACCGMSFPCDDRYRASAIRGVVGRDTPDGTP